MRSERLPSLRASSLAGLRGSRGVGGGKLSRGAPGLPGGGGWVLPPAPPQPHRERACTQAKGYQDCRFDVKEGEDFRVLKKIGEKGRAFRIVNERGQLGHLQRELVSCLWPVNASILSRLDWRLVTGLVTEVSQLNARARAGEERIFFFLFLVWPYNKQLINRATV